MNAWVVITFAAGVVICGLGIYTAIRSMQQGHERVRDQKGQNENIPMTLMQIRSIWAMVNILAGSGLIIYLIISRPITDFFEDASYRIVVTVILTVMLLINLFIMIPTSRKGKWSDLLDERDQQVLDKATNFQIAGILLINAIWAVGLTEYYWSVQTIPIQFPYLMFWSSFLMLFLSRSVGIIYGYWWMNHYGN